MSGSAKAGTTAERHTLRAANLAFRFLRAPQKRASGELYFLLTLTYMDVGHPEAIRRRRSRKLSAPHAADKLYT